MQRRHTRTARFLFALGARVVWGEMGYVIDRRRWEERRLMGPVVQYGLVEGEGNPPGPVILWADEADLQVDDRLRP